MGAVATLLGWLIVGAISYLQPLLIPVAIAAILAYLLEPLVEWLENRRLSRTMSVITVFSVSVAIVAGILIYIIPAVGNQGQQFATNMPEYTARAQTLFNDTIENAKRLSELPIFQRPDDPVAHPNIFSGYIATAIDEGVAWLQKKLPDIAVAAGQFLQKSVGGFLGVFGFLLSLILVPIFLFFFLKEGHSISENWSNYLPLRASPLKSEIVSLLNEINNYLINFFRGQLLVSLIDGLLIGFLPSRVRAARVFLAHRTDGRPSRTHPLSRHDDLLDSRSDHRRRAVWRLVASPAGHHHLRRRPITSTE